MNDIRKVPFGAGAEWLLGGIALLRKAPLALGLLGLIWGGLSALATASGQLWLSLLLALAGPLLFGGIVYAAREVDQGRSATPAHLIQGVRDGKLPRLLAMLLPQVAALLLMGLLMVVIVGPDELQHLNQALLQMQTNPDPALVESLPAGRLMLWLLAVVVVGVVTGFFTFVAIPEVMFTDRGAFAAMALSFRACLRNVGALLVMIVLLLIATFALSLALQLLGALLAFAIGAQASMFVVQLLLMAMLLPVMAGAVYLAWRQLVGDAPVVASSAHGFEA
ncbi:BPSS1780 family membrane protein [Lysobacter sp. F60174L2]|uniref:BPSS1780 family membrane protein n=1 Tax=Lysobacter sp. F60174L2 TaxID=3459295 RepID=UPI00403D7133